jgi:hypothetical protein
MGRSLRAAAREPDGSFTDTPAGTQFLVRTGAGGVFQRMLHDGAPPAEYRIDYVIGSGAHASCYLARVGDHLFESPICRYPSRGYAMAPGYEDNPDPGYTRPVTLECLQCHSGRPLPIAGSLNRYQSPAFDAEAITCDRCHGDPAAHLARPTPGSIVNPAKLSPAARDSVCEQCHLAGLIRVLNPGKSIADYHPGQLLESVFSTYVSTAAAAGQTVVSQSEQLALSRCAVASSSRLACATCHDPHSIPADRVSFFRARCLSCHRAALPAGHPARTADCLPCHMPRREAVDGGHTAFTDHRILRRPFPAPSAAPTVDDLRPWREPDPSLRKRNLALALNFAGQKLSNESLLDRSYLLLDEAQSATPGDPDLLAALGAVLQARRQPAEAASYFDRALALRPADVSLLDSAASARLAAGDPSAATGLFERALAIDPLLLPDIESLLNIYRAAGDHARESALMLRVRDAMRTPPPKR